MINKIIGYCSISTNPNLTKKEQAICFTSKPDTFERSNTMISFKGDDKLDDEEVNTNKPENTDKTSKDERLKNANAKGKKIREARKAFKNTGIPPKDAYEIKQKLEFLGIGLITVGVTGAFSLLAVASAYGIAKTADAVNDKFFADKDGKSGLSMSVDTENKVLDSKDFDVHIDMEKGIISMSNIDIRPERFTGFDMQRLIFKNEAKGIDIDLSDKHHIKYIDPEHGIHIDLSEGHKVAEITLPNGHIQHINPNVIESMVNFGTSMDRIDHDPHDTYIVQKPFLEELWDNLRGAPLDIVEIKHLPSGDYVIDQKGNVYRGDELHLHQQPIAHLDPHIDPNVYDAFLHPLVQVPDVDSSDFNV